MIRLRYSREVAALLEVRSSECYAAQHKRMRKRRAKVNNDDDNNNYYLL